MTHPFTPEYIQMVKAAEEIQALRPHPTDRSWEAGDWYLRIRDNRESDLNFEELECTARGDIQAYADMKYPWIPRLDQLLGMLGHSMEIFMAHLQKHQNTVVRHFSLGDTFDCEWHELALVLVMREKHGRIWRPEQGKWYKPL